MGSKWYEETSAAEETEGVLSTMAVLRFRSIAWTVDACHAKISNPLYTPEHAFPYINNPTQRSDRIRSVDYITPHRRRVFHDRARDHDDILGRLCQLLDDEVHHLPEGGIFILKELRDAEEEGGRFVGGELLAGEEEEGDLGEEDATSARRDGG